LRIARLRRNANGQVELDQAYVPPSLRIGAAGKLMEDLRGLLQVLMAKIAVLSQGRKQVEGGFAAFSAGEETAFRLLQTLNTFTPVLAHYHFTATVHPYDLFTTLSQLAGALCTFSTEYEITRLPRYDHTAPGGTFTTLLGIIRGILTADISAGCIALPIEQIQQATYLCPVNEKKLFDTARFYFGVAADVPERELIVGVVQRIKMCSRERLELLISSAMPGLRLMHVSSPPEGLSTKPSFVYFSIDQKGEFWEGVRTSGQLAFYFPHNFPGLRMELLALKG
jgi:type VI secretion system protein ImpJ